MRISPMLGQQNGLINVERVNQSVAKSPDQVKRLHIVQGQRDRATISPRGRAANLLNQLNKQKANILERRDQFLQQAHKQGQSDDVIKSQLEQFDEQLRQIDQQIQEANLQKMKDASEKAVPKEKTEKPKTKQEVQNNIMSNLMDAAASVDRMEDVSAQKAGIDGDARVLKSEIELDKVRGASAEDLAPKEDRLAQLQSRSQGLMQDIGEGLSETNEILAENTELSATKPMDADKAEKQDGDKGHTESLDKRTKPDHASEEQGEAEKTAVFEK